MFNISSVQTINYAILNKIRATFTSRNLVILVVALAAISCLAAIFQYCRNGKSIQRQLGGAKKRH